MSDTKLIGICNRSQVAFEVPAGVQGLLDSAAAIDVDRGQDTLDPSYSYSEGLSDQQTGYWFHNVAADIAVDDLSEADIIEIRYGRPVGIVECAYSL